MENPELILDSLQEITMFPPRHNRMHLVRIMLALLVLIVWASAVRAAVRTMPQTVSDLATRTKLITGSFCLTNLPPGSVRPLPESESDGNGVWWHVKIRVTGQASGRGSKPRAFVYSEEPSGNGGPIECKDNMGGTVRTLLAGNLNSAEIDAWYMPETAGEPARWQFPYDPAAKPSFSAELGGVVANFDTLYGGTLDPKRRLVWLRNSSEIIFQKKGRAGTFDLEMVDIELANARVELGDGYPLSPTTLVAESRSDPQHPDKGHVTFEMNVANAALAFRRGELYSKGDVSLAAGELRLDGATFALNAGTVHRLSLAGRGKSNPEVVLGGLSLSASSVSHDSPRFLAVPNRPVTIARGSGQTGQAKDRAVVSGVVLEGLELASDQLGIGGMPGAPSLSGKGTVKVGRLSQDTFTDAAIKLDSPNLPGLVKVLGGFANHALSLSASGSKASPLINGDLAVSKARLGGLALAAVSDLKTQFHFDTPANASWRVHFDYDGSPTAAHWEWRDPAGGTVLIDGAVDRLGLHGYVDLEDAGWTVAVKPGGLDLAASGQVSRKEFLLGATPQFSVGAKLGLSSATGFAANAAGATGSCDMTAGVITLNNAHLSFNDPSQRFKIDVPVTMSADTTLRYDFGSGEVSLMRGHASVTGLGASSSDPSKPVELADLKLTAPSLTAGSLEIDVQAGAGTITLKALSFAATRVEHTGDPYLALDLSGGLALPLVEAALSRDARGSLKLESVKAEKVSLAASNTVFRSKEGFQVSGRRAQLTAEAIGLGFVQNGRLKIEDGEVLLSLKDDAGQLGVRTAVEVFDTTFSGTKDHLSGAGHLVLSNVDASYHGAFAVNDKCTSPGDRWKLKARVGLGKIDIQSQFQDSSIVGTGHVADAGFEVNEDGYSECNFDEEHSIRDEKRIIFDYPCGLDGWNIKMCRSESTIGYEIPFSIHWVASLSKLNVGGRIGSTDISIRGQQGVGFCAKDYQLNPPLIVASYAPGVRRDPHLPLVSDIVHEALKGVATSFESSFAEVLGLSASGATFLNNVLGLRAPICG